VTHRSNNCPTGFPSGTDYKVCTQSDVDCAKCHVARPAIAAVGDTFKMDGSDDVHPVAAVLGSTHNPTAYVANNTSSIIECDAEDDLLSSGSISVSTVPLSDKLSATRSEPEAKGQSVLPPFYVLHLFWECKANSTHTEFPVEIRVLIDHGSHSVLIREDLVETLGLRRCRLLKPEKVELTMSNGGVKVEIKLSEWVKLKLYDPSSFWTGRTIRAIIAP